MHRFLRAVGFSRLSELDDEDRLIQDVCAHSDSRKAGRIENGYHFCEFSRQFGKNFGITVCGMIDRENQFHVQYYFPYLYGECVDTLESIAIDQHMRTFSFAAACDDMRLGTTIIFYVENAADYLQIGMPKMLEDPLQVRYAGLAESGTILLPVVSDHRPQTEDPGVTEHRTNLYRAAQNGDEEAIESLTMEDYDLYTTISRRAQKEDVYSIVDSYFIPYGMECDLYNVMGEITNVNYASNTVTGEKIVRLSIITNEIPMEICINEKDLLGEPEIGRRFKGVIWLQGHLCLNGEDIQSAGI